MAEASSAVDADISVNDLREEEEIRPQNAIQDLLDAALTANPQYESIIADWNVLYKFWTVRGWLDSINLHPDVASSRIMSTTQRPRPSSWSSSLRLSHTEKVGH